MEKPETIKEGDRVEYHLIKRLVYLENGQLKYTSSNPKIAGIALSNTEYDEETDSYRVLVQMY